MKPTWIIGIIGILILFITCFSGCIETDSDRNNFVGVWSIDWEVHPTEPIIRFNEDGTGEVYLSSDYTKDPQNVALRRIGYINWELTSKLLDKYVTIEYVDMSIGTVEYTYEFRDNYNTLILQSSPDPFYRIYHQWYNEPVEILD